MRYARDLLRPHLNALIAITAILVIVGSIFIYSASSVYAIELFGDAGHYVKRQLFGLAIGIAGIIVVQFIPMRILQRGSPLFFLATIGFTALTLVNRYTLHIHGSSRWLSLAGIRFQPSELIKVTLVLYLAYLIDKKNERRSSFIHGYLPILTAVALPCLILLKQPDFGLTVTLSLTALSMLFVANYAMHYILYTALVLAPFALGLVIMRPYRLQRVLSFLNPWSDPRGSGFQIIQSLIAIGSGGLFGLGIANSKQKFFYLPMQHTDFIFSIIAEETGFMGSMILISLFILFLYNGLRLASRLHSRFASLATFGFVALINLQATINICVAASLVPTKGIGLPFVSYGNTALVANLLMVGIIINFVRNDAIRG